MDTEWPGELVIVRHGESEYNALKKLREKDPCYKEFVKAYATAWDSPHNLEAAQELAEEIQQKFVLDRSSEKTALTDIGKQQAITTGENLKHEISLPDAIFVSTHLRTRQTFECLKEGWPELGKVSCVHFDERIREQEHGTALLYNDWRVFDVLNPQQKRLYDQEGMYHYRYPNGENIPDLNLRIGLCIDFMRQRYSGKKVLFIGHHIAILSKRMIIEGFRPEEFIRLDKEEKPINCGVTVYRHEDDPTHEGGGKLVLKCYNMKLYD